MNIRNYTQMVISYNVSVRCTFNLLLQSSKIFVVRVFICACFKVQRTEIYKRVTKRIFF
jgi:hypothetical protein